MHDSYEPPIVQATRWHWSSEWDHLERIFVEGTCCDHQLHAAERPWRRCARCGAATMPPPRVSRPLGGAGEEGVDDEAA